MFITQFKKIKVLPIHKKGQLTNMNNYRPISIIPSLSKNLEKLMFIRLESFLEQINFFNKNQFGFRKNHSTEQATTLLVNHITNKMDENNKIMGIVLDLSKAFDCID